MKRLICALVLLGIVARAAFIPPGSGTTTGSGILTLNGIGTNTTFYGQNFLNSTGAPLMYLGGLNDFATEERMLRGTWHDLPAGNLLRSRSAVTIEHYLNAGAASDAYFNAISGSGSALADLPTRGPEIWANQLKPYVVISTRSGDGGPNIFSMCNQTTVIGGVKALGTNGYTTYFTNQGIGMAYSVEDGWLATHRAAGTGLLRWNTNRFPMATGFDTMPTNFTVYLATNKLETWLMLYQINRVPNPANWQSSKHSELDINPLGDTGVYWEYSPFGGQADPTGGLEFQPAITLDSAHMDISTLYQWGVRGVSLQDCVGAASGYHDQMAHAFGSAVLNPYKNPGQSTQILEDGQWNRYYPLGVQDGTTMNVHTGTSASHGMILNMFFGSVGVPWSVNHTLDANGIYVESNGFTPGPTGSRAVGWFLEQALANSQAMTNAVGYCRFIPGGDGADFANYNYLDWKSYFTGCAMFNCNYWLTVASSTYNYMQTTTFAMNFTNAPWTAVWQEQNPQPPKVLTRGTKNATVTRTRANGDILVWFANEDTSTVDLTVTAGQLGIPSNTVFQVFDVGTNTVRGIFTNSYTETIPAAGASLVGIKMFPTATDGASSIQLVQNGVAGELVYKGTNFLNVQSSGAFATVGINTPTLVGSSLVVGGKLTLSDSYGVGGANYDFIRDASTGWMNITGPQGSANSGISIRGNGGTGTEFASLSGTPGLALNTIGAGLNIKTGTNAKLGTVALSGTTTTVNNTSVTANSRIFLTSQSDGGTPGFLRVTAKVNGTSFTITSSTGNLDTSTVAWMIVESIP